MADSGTYDQATIVRRQRLAEQMLADSVKPQPIRHWAQGAAQLANTGLAAYSLNQADEEARAARKADTAALMAGLGMGDQPAAASAPSPASSPLAAPSPAPASPMPAPSPQVLGMGGKPETPDAQGAYSADAVMMPPAGPATASTEPRGIRNNNPLNIENGPFARSMPGYTGGDSRFAQFETPNHGMQAASNLLDVYQNKHGLNTVRGIINRWAPPGEAANNTPGYVASVAGRLGIDPDQPLTPEMRPKLIQAMAQFENGKPLTGQAAIAQAMTPGGPMAFNGTPQPGPAAPPSTAPAPAGAPPAAAPQGGQPILGAPPGIPSSQREAIARLLSATPGSAAYQLGLQLAGQVVKPHDYTFQTLPDGTVLRMDPTGRTPPTPVYQAPVKPQFVPNVSPNAYGVAQPGFVDPMKMQAFDITGKPMAGNPSSPAVSANPDVTGEDFLKTMPKPQADQIKGIVEGRISPPGAFALKTPYWQKMLTDVAQYEPGFDLTKWGARNATAKDFASGKSAQNITAFNTAISHLDTLDKAADALGNTRFPMVNSVKNMIASGTGDPQVKQFDVAKTAVADELTRAFRGTGGNVHDLVQWENAINAANSPAQLKAAVKQATELLRGRIEALGETYNRGMNTQTEPIKLLSPKAQAVLGRLSGEGVPEKTAPTATETAPKIGDEKQFKQGTGVWDGKQWVPKATGGPSA